MSYNPFLPASGGVVRTSDGNPFAAYNLPAAPFVEEKDEDFIDPQRFADVFVNGRYTPGKKAHSIDVAFGNIDLDDAADFFKYLASEEGQDELVRGLVSLFVQRGDITVLEAINILADD